MTDPLGAQSGADPNAQSGGTGTGGAGSGTTSTTDSGGGSTGAGTATTDPGQSATVPASELEAVRARMVAADKRASEAEQALRAVRDKDLPELERLKRDTTEQAAKIEAMNAELSALRVEKAFLTANTHKWRSNEAALQLLDRSKVTVDTDGNVAGIKDALEALAKKHPYLLEPASGEEGAGQQQPPLGTPPANAGLGGGTKTTPAAAAARFPAMRSRLG